MKHKKAYKIMMFLLIFCGLPPFLSYAQVPGQIEFQGQLTDNSGNLVSDGFYTIHFALYDTDTGVTALWNEQQSVWVQNGVYNIVLGQPGNELSADLFLSNLFLGVKVGSDPEMTPRLQLASVPFSLRAGVADKVMDDAVDTVHIANDAITGAKIDNGTIGSVDLSDGTALDEITDDDGSGSGLDADRLDGHDTAYFATAAQMLDLQNQVSLLQSQVNTLVALLSNVSRPDGNTIRFSNVNLQIVNGTGTTTGTVNGLGNLIVGYDEARTSGSDKTGSHNIVLGRNHNYSGYAGLVAGYENSVSGNYASVSGGQRNTASGDFASVSGGFLNTASNGGSSVSGGFGNTANALTSSVSGGNNNTASNSYASISGGQANTASGKYASISGGRYNEASGDRSSISGGRYNKASGEYSFVGGGGDEDSVNGNEAFSNYSAILGGNNNITGDNSDPEDHTTGISATVLGGRSNKAIGFLSSISGGYANTASGERSSVSGGRANTASGENSSVSAGYNNTAGGENASISGGRSNTAGGSTSSVSGGRQNTASGWSSSVSGGKYNTASGDYSFIGGGGGQNDYEGNIAFADYSAILGGRANGTGDMDRAFNGSGGYYELVPGADHNIGIQSAVSGGYANIAGGENASVSGGGRNRATGYVASVSGGVANNASGENSSISAGRVNKASGSYSSVTGGNNNEASGSYASVTGGHANDATGSYASVTGGFHNEASGGYSFIGGGGGFYPWDGNIAFADYSAILGGRANGTGDVSREYHMSGDYYELVPGTDHSIGIQSAVSGGYTNIARGESASVSGGRLNTAGGENSSVSGGDERSVHGDYDWRAGDLFEGD